LSGHFHLFEGLSGVGIIAGRATGTINMPAGYVAVDQGQIYYDDVGHGARTIVWVHGLSLNGDD
jgi:hypothetical protein